MTAIEGSAPALTPGQARALEVLHGADPVFVTGGAGSGKSFLIHRVLREWRRNTGEIYPVLASTGAAAILVGGRTFHSFFGLGILEGGVERTVEKAIKNKRLGARLRATDGVVIDEISMIPGAALRAAEAIARKVRTKDSPWGGLRVIAVGDFGQLPPVTRGPGARDWAFLDETWTKTGFLPAVLPEIVRTQDPEFLEILNLVRQGQVTERVARFLNARLDPHPDRFDGTRMFPFRRSTEEYNLSELAKLAGEPRVFATQYAGKAEAVEDFKRNSPVPELIQLKPGALVMIRQNDPQGRWVNGTTAHVASLPEPGETALRLSLEGGAEIELEPTTFHLLDANGDRVASATNFPVSLAYATTIHKAQGATLDRLCVDLRNLWEPGHAYVALSRVRDPRGLSIEGWHPRSVIVDRHVTEFYRGLA